MANIGVLCAIDVNDYDQNTVDVAAFFAKQLSLPLDLLHVSLAPDPAKAMWPAYVGAIDLAAKDYRALEQIHTCVQGVQVIHHHLSGLPAEKIAGFANRNSPELLVMGTHARQGLKRVFGSVAAKVMRNVDCPVLVLRQGQGTPHQLKKKKSVPNTHPPLQPGVSQE